MLVIVDNNLSTIPDSLATLTFLHTLWYVSKLNFICSPPQTIYFYIQFGWQPDQ